MHELVHILEISKDTMRFIDRDITEEPESEVERKVNQTTRDLLIPSD